LFRAECVTVPTQDIVVFDEESDRHVIIPWEDAIAASFCTMNGAPNGMGAVSNAAVMKAGAGLNAGEANTYITTQSDTQVAAAAATVAGNANAVQAQVIADVGTSAFPGAAASADLTAGEWRDLANCWRMIAKYGVGHDFGNAGGAAGAGNFPILDAVAGAIGDSFSISNRFRGKDMQKFMEIPEFRVYCVVTRPFIEHVMMSAIMAVSGRDTGAMLFGPSGDFNCANPPPRLRFPRDTGSLSQRTLWMV
jgi:hypothetical protein